MDNPIFTKDPQLSVDLSKLDGSDLKQLMTGNAQSLLTLGKEAKDFVGKPVSTAADRLAMGISFSAPGSWKTSTGIGFSLKAAASCKVAIGSKSTCFKVAKTIDATDLQEIYGQAPTGAVYINIDIDFDIQGNLSASGSVGAIGIAGKVSNTGAATFTYCHPIAAETETRDAITAAFRSLKFPFQPDSVTGMTVGAIASVKFDASLGLELDVSYGLGKYRVAAPGISAARQSLTIGTEKFTPPSLTTSTGVKASFGYIHAEHYEAIVSRTGAIAATLLLSRSASEETDESLGFSAGITLTGAPTASTDPVALGKAIDGVTGSGGDKAAAAVNDLQSSLVSASCSWLNGKSGGPGSVCLSETLSQQKTRAVLYEFSIDLTSTALAEHSCSEYAAGDLTSAMRAGSLTLLPGSGVSECFKRSNAIHLQFFNLFTATDTATYFKDTYTSVGLDGSLRYSFDIGREAKEEVRKALQQTSLHFVASAPEQDGSVATAEVDLHIDMTEAGKPNAGNLLVDGLAQIVTASQQAQLKQFLHESPKGTLNLQVRYAQAAYGRLQGRQDPANWQAFQQAAVRLMGLAFASALSYDDWALFNRISLDGTDENGQPRRAQPDRSNCGNPAAVPQSFYDDRHVSAEAMTVRYFLLASAQFMNLCAGLATLANESLSQQDTRQSWDELIANVEQLVLSDVNTDWSLAAASALMTLCQGSVTASSLQQQKDKVTFIASVA